MSDQDPQHDHTGSAVGRPVDQTAPDGGYAPTYGGTPPEYGQQPYGQESGYAAPSGGQPYAQNPYGQPPYPQNGYAADPYGRPAYPNGPAALRSDYASWGKRVGAYLIDIAPNILAVIVFYAGFLPYVASASSPGFGSGTIPGLVPMGVGSVLMLVALGWQIYNRWITAGRTGQSLGRRVTHIALVSEQTGQPIGALNAFLRDLLHVLDSFAYVGYLWPLWDERKQTFSDKIMKTVVVDAPRRS